MCEMTFACEPQVTCAIGTSVVTASTTLTLNSQMEQIVFLMREVVSIVKGDDNNRSRPVSNENRQGRTNRPLICFACQQSGHYSYE